MGNRHEDKLRLLLKRAPLSEPLQDFTNEVMKELNAMEEEAVYAKVDLKVLLQKQILPIPSNAFTYKILNKTREAKPYKPVISKGAWATITAFILICILTGILTSNASSTGNGHFISIGNFLANWIPRYSEVIIYFAIVLTSGGSLLLLDYFLHRSRSSHNTQAR